MTLTIGPRRGIYVDISERLARTGPPLTTTEIERFEAFDLVYRSLCALMYNYVPKSGHPGWSISSGRFVAGMLFDALDYDVSDPDRADADLISYAAGHKALGLYALWALRNEALRIAAPDLMPRDVKLPSCASRIRISAPWRPGRAGQRPRPCQLHAGAAASVARGRARRLARPPPARTA